MKSILVYPPDFPQISLPTVKPRYVNTARHAY